MKSKKFDIPKSKRILDRKFSQYILNKYGRICMKCGATDKKCDVSHSLPREYLNLRYSEENTCVLCSGCHKFKVDAWHKSPLQNAKWFIEKFPGRFELLLSLLEIPFEFTQEFFDKKSKELNICT